MPESNTPWQQLIAALLAALGELSPAVDVSVSINGTAWSGALSELSAALHAPGLPVEVVVSVGAT